MKNQKNSKIIVLVAVVVIIMFGLGICMVKAQSALLLQEERAMSYAEKNGVSTFYSIRNTFRLIASGVFAFLFLYFRPKFMKYKERKEQEYDEKVVKRAVAEVIPGAEFIRNQCFAPSELRNYGILPFYDSYRENGILYYQRDGRGQRISNLYLLERHEDSKGRTSYQIAYRGQVYTAHYQTELSGTVRIFTTKILPVINKETIGSYPAKRKEETKIETENVWFNNQFDVYATDAQSAFFVLNPIVIEQLMEMKRQYEQFGIFIQGDQITITLETDRLFFPKQMYKNEQEGQDILIVKEEAKKLMQTASLLEDTLNGSIEHNYTNLRGR